MPINSNMSNSLLYHLLCLSIHVSGTSTLYCLSCQHVTSPKHCKYVTSCSNNEVCYMEEYLNTLGDTLYNLGCHSPTPCNGRLDVDLQPVLSKRQYLINSHTSLSECLRCCHGDLCNVNGCGDHGYPSSRGPVCFNCQQASHPGKCDIIHVCEKGESCHIYSLQEFGETIYSTGCIASDLCKILNSNPMSQGFGKRSVRAVRRIRSDPSCNRCCSSDICNQMCVGSGNSTRTVAASSHYTTQSTTSYPIRGHTGKEYIIAFPEHISNLTHAQVMITAMVDTTVTLESPHPGVSRTVNVTAASGATVNLPTSLMQRGNAIEQKGVLIKSPVDIAVYVYAHDSSNKGEAYSAIPVRNLGTSYIGAALYHSFVSIVAWHDNTHVNITPRHKTELFNGKYYNSGDTINIYLSKLSTFQIKWTAQSYGTDIKSDKPISVISGSSCYDMYYGRSASHCSFYVENMPPIKSFGDSFIIPQFPQGNLSYYLLYSQSNGSHIHYQAKDDNNSTTFKEYMYIEREPVVPYRFDTDHHAVVVYYSNHINNQFPSKIIIPALSQYSNNYKYITPSSVSFENHVGIIIKADYMGGLRVDHKTINSMKPEIQGIIAGNGLYNVLTFNVTSGQHSAHHVDSAVTFGMIAYGYRSGEMYGFPVGLRLW